ncbi:DNA breaking-rejoining enzyme [Suillus subalutaceus]|uniref:DNA breaking-rejoining enzyme n=1 Tax=Suillus subalutaceus TaxID=48586 RepID=UPI001B87F2AF|nr:DNA breaking-rejoining enzyme [Suillus subalutaceus]KAG1838711.1 DNA breaking-rejoining enzyme [Suillus subalutaceus]
MLNPPRIRLMGCKIAPSSFRPHVLARDHLCHWTAPISNTFHSELVRDFTLGDIMQLFNILLVSVEPITRENYGAGLLRFHQFCNSQSIPESCRMPASDNLLALFIASWAGQLQQQRLRIGSLACTCGTICIVHHGMVMPYYTCPQLGVKKLVPESSKCPHRPPVTLEHMHVLYHHLDLSNAFDASIFAVASVAFWSCCRLGELIMSSINSFDPSRHVARSANITHRSPANSISWSAFPIPWSKTPLSTGAKIILSRVDNLTNPMSALNHHISANAIIPPQAPSFAFETASGGWAPMTRPWFLARCNQVWKGAGLLELTGHCFRIGGAMELLLRGVPPDVVAIQGCWKSRAFLEYWCNIDSILPLFLLHT